MVEAKVNSSVSWHKRMRFMQQDVGSSICNKSIQDHGMRQWGNILGFHVKEEEVKETKKLNNLGIWFLGPKLEKGLYSFPPVNQIGSNILVANVHRNISQERLQMDVVAKFPTRVSCHYPGINLDIKKRLTLSFSPRKTTCKLHKKIEIQQRSICVKNVKNGTWDSNRISAILSKRGPKSGKNSMSPAEIVDHFYICINEKELKQLDEYISQDACFYDYTFINPFQGKKVCISTILLSCNNLEVTPIASSK